ncbi:MAG: PQQ-binding-like beta-propeller repeat protein [bacterium]|nr:MAG: PQQ-binding-like beta-propeller repeat protein [bacterium]
MKAITYKALMASFICITALALILQAAEAADHIWPMYRHDIEHTGRSPYIGAQNSSLRWRCELGDGVYSSSPAIAEDGTIYIGANDGNLYAVHPDGTIYWTYPIGGAVYSSPAIDSGGTIYVGLWRDNMDHGKGAVYAINPNGTLKWRYPPTGYILDIESSPVIDPVSGVIYVGGARQIPWGGRFYAINPDGTYKCSFNPGDDGWMPASPAIRGDGKIIIGDYNNPDGIMWAINPENCSVHDQVTVGYDIKSSAAIDAARQRIYFGNSQDTGNKLWAYNFDLNFEWSFTTGDHIVGCPAIGADGTIYVGSYDNNLYAVNPDGSEKWRYTTGGDIYSSPAIGADGTIYVGSKNHRLYAIDSSGALKWSYKTDGAIYSSPAIGPNGGTYVGSMDGHLYCLGTYCNVNPTYFDFNGVCVGCYLDTTFTITNYHTDTLIGSVTESCIHYSIESGGGPYSLALGESLVVTVRFEPVSPGTHDCTIETGHSACSDVTCTGGHFTCPLSVTNDAGSASFVYFTVSGSGGSLRNCTVTNNPPGCPYPTKTVSGNMIYIDWRDICCFDPTETLELIVQNDYPCEQLSISYVWYKFTAVELSSFTATGFDDHIQVDWKTATEIGSAGFNIYRSLDRETPQSLLNEELIRTRGDELQGASYSFIDDDVAGSVTYYYWLEDVSLDGRSTLHGPIPATTGQKEEPIPNAFSLDNYPNPFNATTVITYGLPVDCDVTLTIYNLMGQKVKTLVNEHQGSGYKSVNWDGRNEEGIEVSSGIYFYRLRAGSHTEIKKMILLK